MLFVFVVLYIPLAEHVGVGVTQFPLDPHSTTPLKSYPALQVTEASPAYTVSPLKTPFATTSGPQSK